MAGILKYSPGKSMNLLLIHGDARNLSFIRDESCHLALTSPPYWTLKRYNDSPGQLGHVSDYEKFLAELE
jgi:site-specific DNA-methyltransferase (adenine-specific)